MSTTTPAYGQGIARQFRYGNGSRFDRLLEDMAGWAREVVRSLDIAAMPGGALVPLLELQGTVETYDALLTQAIRIEDGDDVLVDEAIGRPTA